VKFGWFCENRDVGVVDCKHLKLVIPSYDNTYVDLSLEWWWVKSESCIAIIRRGSVSDRVTGVGMLSLRLRWSMLVVEPHTILPGAAW